VSEGKGDRVLEASRGTTSRYGMIWHVLDRRMTGSGCRARIRSLGGRGMGEGAVQGL